jgi:hypothetical protein
MWPEAKNANSDAEIMTCSVISVVFLVTVFFRVIIHATLAQTSRRSQGLVDWTQLLLTSLE